MLTIGYRYAQLNNTSNKWYVYFYVTNPLNGLLERQRVYINLIKSESNKVRYANKLIEYINNRLDNGWNPLVNDNNKKQYTKTLEALDYVLNYKLAYIREASKANYKSRIKILIDWLKENKKDKSFIFEFTDQVAIDFMNDLLLKMKIKGRTYNNYLIDMRGFFNLLKKHKFIKENPFHAVERMPEESKIKQPFTVEQQSIYSKYVKENDYDFYIISQYTYYLALRPKEITMLKVSDIDFRKQLIRVPGTVSKNKLNRFVTIPDQFWMELEGYLRNQDKNFYLCSSGFKPGKTKIAPTRIAEHFRKIADIIKLPKDVYFYSLKDTTADRLLENGFNIKDIRDLFDHQNIATTDNYLRKRNPHLNKRLKTAFPDFN